MLTLVWLTRDSFDLVESSWLSLYDLARYSTYRSSVVRTTEALWCHFKERKSGLVFRLSCENFGTITWWGTIGVDLVLREGAWDNEVNQQQHQAASDPRLLVLLQWPWAFPLLWADPGVVCSVRAGREERVWRSRQGELPSGVEQLVPVAHHHLAAESAQDPGGLVRAPLSSAAGLQSLSLSSHLLTVLLVSAGRFCSSSRPRTEFHCESTGTNNIMDGWIDRWINGCMND